MSEMRVSLSIIDLTALPDWPSTLLAGVEIQKATDPHFVLRMTSPQSLAPARIQVSTLRHGLVLLSVIDHQ